MTRAEIQLDTSVMLPPFTGATAWLNSPPLSPDELRGKVVLVNFWTYTCINWLRTLPYIRAWADKYNNQGLVVIGVHTPEFAFENDIENVKKAISTNDITYPVAVDNDYAVWSAFDNHFWPAFYFVDANGRIRYQQFGEGEYEMAERVIQQLLVEAGADNVAENLISLNPDGVEKAADWDNVESPETYIGYARTMNLATSGDHPNGDITLRLNQWTLIGGWVVGEGAAMLHDANGKIVFRFHARDLNLVMGPPKDKSAVPFRVTIDGEPPRNAHGIDVDEEGNGTVTEQRMYQLIRQPKPIFDRQFEIEFLEPGVEALVFTFG
jgi:thiol-disulfide isomerase/thioredoxin